MNEKKIEDINGAVKDYAFVYYDHNVHQYIGEILLATVSEDGTKVQLDYAGKDIPATWSKTTMKDVTKKEYNFDPWTAFVKVPDDMDEIASNGIDWDRVREVVGRTYDIREALRSEGFKWDKVSRSYKK